MNFDINLGLILSCYRCWQPPVIIVDNFVLMKFTRYYSTLIKASGVPHLSVEQLQVINNIITLEIRINEQELINKYLSGDAKVMLNKRSYSCYSKLHNLTDGRAPDDVFKTIMLSSKMN